MSDLCNHFHQVKESIEPNTKGCEEREKKHLPCYVHEEYY
jgi:hypothetical protein